jgi:hypothetical protein
LKIRNSGEDRKNVRGSYFKLARKATIGEWDEEMSSDEGTGRLDYKPDESISYECIYCTHVETEIVVMQLLLSPCT